MNPADWEQPKPCCLCGGQDFRLLFQLEAYRIMRCRACGLAQTVSLISAPNAPYDEDYFKGLNDYWSRREEFRPVFTRILTAIEQFTSPGNLLDVGCGIGLLLDVACGRGWETQGVEISAYASDFAVTQLNLAVQNGTLQAAHFPTASFDVVTMSAVLEHVPWPPAELQEISRLLRPGGLIAVGVPNLGSWLARLDGPRWYSLQPESHVWHFTPKTLQALLGRYGFKRLTGYTENHTVKGWRPKALFRRVIGWAALRAGAGEGMLVVYAKTDCQAT